MATKKPDPISVILTDYISTRKERLKLDEQSKKLKEKEDALLGQLAHLKAGAYHHPPFDLEVSMKPTPRCTDWGNFYAYLKETGNLDMLTKHLTASAINARIESGEYVPGIVIDEKPTFKITLA